MVQPLNLFLVLSQVLAAYAIVLDIPHSPRAGRQIVDASYQAFSIEFFSFLDYSSNSTYSNPLNYNLVKNIREIGKRPINVRIGGSSQNHVWWAPDQEEGLRAWFWPDSTGYQKTYNVTIGPKFYDAFDAWPSDTEFTLGLPFSYYNYSYLESNIEIARRAHVKLGNRLTGLQVGNEMKAPAFRFLEPQTPSDYVPHWLNYVYNISNAVFGKQNERVWTIGAFQAPTWINCSDPLSIDCWSIRSILELGINAEDLGVAADVHEYMETSSSNYVDRQFLMNHNNTIYYPDSNAELAAYAKSKGLDYWLGETNSISGHGKINVSDTFAAALWNIDYTLYCAQTNISRLGFHQGIGWKYSAWNPIEMWVYPSGVMASYYAWLVVQTALAGAGKQVELLISEKHLVAYAIYEVGRHRRLDTNLSSIVIVNLEDWDSTNDATSRPYVEFELPRNISRKAQLSRLTAAGADVKAARAITFAGQLVNETGMIEGDRHVEKLDRSGKVKVLSSEAVLISFAH
ncbi:hypothetical protein PFICI_02984 [Pestalotiopsis fici W106-1]|uniref:Beta-glucuronidase C-terminal domain-containing protein n=1 Tax=Pestalotiopsis fici (strain W106-1 / CGMCC3.15140) TaxID=1229662 RepID=W3XG23_PESFW|nr:uncharacterized protein PFICI_02984 [Pestalotiopsis fici W106-1]ETS84959.1 hypothetical protein PFICI_02984 [Pestalotiopsis fici W106-1]